MVAPAHITDEFSNLIVRVIDEEIIRAYINVYTPTTGYLNEVGLAVGPLFSGTINSYSLEGSGIDLGRTTIDRLGAGLSPVKEVTIEDGDAIGITISQDCDPPDPPDHTDDNPNDDDNDDDNNTGGGGEPDEPDNDHQDTGTTDHDPSGGDPTGPDGSGGGTSDCDFEIYVGCCNRNVCVPHGPRLPEPLCTGSNAVVIDCSDDRSSNTTGETVNVDHTDCPDDDVVVIGPPIDDDCDTSKEELKKVFSDIPDNDAELLAKLINDNGADMDLDTKEELWHFLSQTGHETGGFTTLQVTENLHYIVNNLLTVWPNRFSQTDTTKLDPDDYKLNAEKLANYAYCCRMGNGDEASQEGWKYRGRGIKQLTGKDNYTNFKTWYNNKI